MRLLTERLAAAAPYLKRIPGRIRTLPAGTLQRLTPNLAVRAFLLCATLAPTAMVQADEGSDGRRSNRLPSARRQLSEQERAAIEEADRNNDLALQYLKEGRAEEAAELLEHVLETRRRLQGDHAFETGSTLYCLGTVYRALGRLADAESMLRDARPGIAGGPPRGRSASATSVRFANLEDRLDLDRDIAG